MDQITETLFEQRCRKGDHRWQDLMSAGVETPPGGAYVVRWCDICGAVTGDFDVDGNLAAKGQLFPFDTPLITKYP